MIICFSVILGSTARRAAARSADSVTDASSRARPGQRGPRRAPLGVLAADRRDADQRAASQAGRGGKRPQETARDERGRRGVWGSRLREGPDCRAAGPSTSAADSSSPSGRSGRLGEKVRAARPAEARATPLPIRAPAFRVGFFPSRAQARPARPPPTRRAVWPARPRKCILRMTWS